MAVLAFIADTTTPNGKALVQLVTETDATETLGFCWLERSGVIIDQESWIHINVTTTEIISNY